MGWKRKGYKRCQHEKGQKPEGQRLKGSSPPDEVREQRMFQMMKLYESKRGSIICSVLLVTAVCEEVTVTRSVGFSGH